MTFFIETNRLIIRNWKEDDIPIFQNMNANPEIRRYFPDLLSYKASKQNVQQMQDIIETQNIGLFAIELKATNSFIGMVGLNYVPKDTDLNFPEAPFYELGWRLDKTVWGNGLATEAAIAILDYAKKMGVEEVFSFTAEVNKPSKRVMEKLDMQFVRSFLHPKVLHDDELATHVLYYKHL